MKETIIREVEYEDKEAFLSAIERSQALHQPWINAPFTAGAFDEYFKRSRLPNQKSFLVCEPLGNIAGVFNINEIIRGAFQSAYLGYYAMSDFAGKGFMSQGLKLVLKHVFNILELHRLEANIQPENTRSIHLVKKNGFRYEGFSPRYLNINNKWCGHERWAITVEDFMINDQAVLQKDFVDLVAYDSAWPMQAQLEIDKIKKILPKNQIVDIQHVGSTAIPGMYAKPIIDIQIAVRSLEEMKIIAVPALQKLGYEYWLQNPDSMRMFFVKGMPPFGEKRTHHVHIVEPTSSHWEGKILFRDYLIAHPDLQEKYEQLKMRLAKEHTYDREAYTNAKSEFVNDILKLAKKK